MWTKLFTSMLLCWTKQGMIGFTKNMHSIGHMCGNPGLNARLWNKRLALSRTLLIADKGRYFYKKRFWKADTVNDCLKQTFVPDWQLIWLASFLGVMAAIYKRHIRGNSGRLTSAFRFSGANFPAHEPAQFPSTGEWKVGNYSLAKGTTLQGRLVYPSFEKFSFNLFWSTNWNKLKILQRCQTRFLQRPDSASIYPSAATAAG